jgi:hypothetical protein
MSTHVPRDIAITEFVFDKLFGYGHYSKIIED